MKIELQVATTEKPEIGFPLLAKSKNSGAVWLFVGHEKAILVYSVARCTPGVGFLGEGMMPIDSGEWDILPPGSQVTFTQE